MGKYAEMLVGQQCSRSAPKPGNSWFRPSRDEVSRLDRATTVRMARDRAVRIADEAALKRDYAVELTGIVRDGRRYVYGSYMPITFQDGVKHASKEPTMVCDGGPSLFGVEIDAETGRITHFDRNGPG